MLSGNTKIAFLVSILLHSNLVMFPFWDLLKKKNEKNPRKELFFPQAFLRVATGSCLLPRAFLRSWAERLSHWSPPACPLLEGFQPCPATSSQSPPPEPESWGQENRKLAVTYESEEDISLSHYLLMSLCGVDPDLPSFFFFFTKQPQVIFNPKMKLLTLLLNI